MSFLWLTKKEEKSWSKKVEQMDVRMTVDDPELLSKMKMIHFTEQDLQRAKCIQPLIEENIEKLVDDFYQTILEIRELKDIIEKHSSVDRLRRTLKIHLIELFNGQIDNRFVEKRLIVAKTHYRIGLKPAWYMCSFQNLQNSLIQIISNEMTIREEASLFIMAITKLLCLEQQLVLEAYESENLRKTEEQYEKAKNGMEKKVLATSQDLVALSEQTHSSVEILIKNSDTVNQMVHESNENSKATQSFTEEGQNKINELVQNIKVIANSIENMNRSVQKLTDASSQITAVVKLVNDIADQTNLLALNSAIEAARAGEHGKGFAVVSGEVRKLSEKTKSSVGKIQELVQTSNEYIQHVLETLKKVNESVHIGNESSHLANEAFLKISRSIDESVKKNHLVKDQMDELVATIKEIGKAMSGVTESAEHLMKIVKGKV
jgi:heme-based aerotactic transducer